MARKKTKRQASAAARAFFAQHAPASEVARMRAATARHDYMVEVGNVGTVYRGGAKKKALKVYNDYVRISMGQPHASRADGEE